MKRVVWRSRWPTPCSASVLLPTSRLKPYLIASEALLEKPVACGPRIRPRKGNGQPLRVEHRSSAPGALARSMARNSWRDLTDWRRRRTYLLVSAAVGMIFHRAQAPYDPHAFLRGFNARTCHALRNRINDKPLIDEDPAASAGNHGRNAASGAVTFVSA